uniref:Uncharacterized protein n=1 Tax=Rhizophora mucronata TaxID=61149 RepID=A0A2P2MN92_RHIMU
MDSNLTSSWFENALIEMRQIGGFHGMTSNS